MFATGFRSASPLHRYPGRGGHGSFLPLSAVTIAVAGALAVGSAGARSVTVGNAEVDLVPAYAVRT